MSSTYTAFWRQLFFFFFICYFFIRSMLNTVKSQLETQWKWKRTDLILFCAERLQENTTKKSYSILTLSCVSLFCQEYFLKQEKKNPCCTCSVCIFINRYILIQTLGPEQIKKIKHFSFFSFELLNLPTYREEHAIASFRKSWEKSVLQQLQGVYVCVWHR